MSESELNEGRCAGRASGVSKLKRTVMMRGVVVAGAAAAFEGGEKGWGPSLDILFVSVDVGTICELLLLCFRSCCEC